MKSTLLPIALLIPILLGAQGNPKYMIAAAGEPISNNEVLLNGTFGEPIVGLVASSEFQWDQGFWAGTLLLEPLGDPSVTAAIEIFPVPVRDELTILTNGNELLGLKVFSLNGQQLLVQTQLQDGPEIKIPMQQLSSGMYVLYVFLKNDTPREYKILKE